MACRTEVQRRKPAHHGTHTGWRALCGRRCGTIATKQVHHIGHATAARGRCAGSCGRSARAIRSSNVVLGTGWGSAIEVDVQEVLNIALGGAAGAIGRVCRCHRRGNGVLCEVLLLFLDGSALNSVGAVAALADKRLGRLVVDRCKSGEFGEELFEEDRWETGNRGGDGWLLRENDVLQGVRYASRLVTDRQGNKPLRHRGHQTASASICRHDPECRDCRCLPWLAAAPFVPVPGCCWAS